MTARFNPQDLSERLVARVLYECRDRVFGLSLDAVVAAHGPGCVPTRAHTYSVLQMLMSLGLVNADSTYTDQPRTCSPLYWLTADGVKAWECIDK